MTPVGVGRRLLFAWHDTRNFVRRVYEGAMEDNVPFLASALTFDALLAAIPLGLLILSLIGHLLSAGAGSQQVDLHQYLGRLLPARPGSGPDPFAPVLALAESVVRTRGTLGLLGLPLFIWFSTRLFGSLRSALCEVFDSPETRSWLTGKLYDVALVIATGLLFVANTAFSEGVAVLMRRSGAFSFLEFFAAQIVAFAFLVTLFAMIFKYAPAHGVRWDTAFVAGLTCSVGVEVAKQVLSFYFVNFVRADRLVSDATLGAMILFVGWVYYMTLVFLIGGQVAQVYEFRRRFAAQRAILSD